MDVFTPEALDWALSHVRMYGDTDIFPVPFEYDAIAHDWNSIKPLISGFDFGEYKVRADRRVFMIKPGGGFRAAIQLDPLDQLVYTAAVYEAAESIEKARVPVDKRVACSYRIELGADGNFFSAEAGWKDFHEESKTLAYSGRYTHVLITDIADFYNQLGQHRIQNALEMAAVSLVRSNNVERFLNELTAKQSQGLPVGQSASIVLAEACLMDVDNFLLRYGATHVRYVDDFRIFCASRREAVELRHALTEYLFTVHRLSLEASKSKIMFVDAFVKEELSDPEEDEERAKISKFNELMSEHLGAGGGYFFEPAEGEREEILTQAQREGFVELFENCASKPPLNLGLAHYLLNKARRTRTTALNDLVFQNLQGLSPVMRNVVRYLSVTVPKKRAKERGKQLLEFVDNSDVGGLPFVRMWLIELLLLRPDLFETKDAFKFASETSKLLGMRPLALTAAAYNQVDWIRARKESWKNNEPWDRRALIKSASALPSGERRPFLKMVVEQGDPLDSATAKWLLSS